MSTDLMRGVLRVLLVLGLVVTMGGSAWAECLAASLPSGRMVCCEMMSHDCGSAAIEMDCCPPEPQGRLQAATVKPDVTASVPLTGPLAILPEPHVRLHPVAAGSFDREALKLPDRPVYLLHSTFLI